MTAQQTYALCGYYLQPGHFSTQDWETINAIDAQGRLIANLLKPVFYLSQDSESLYELPAFAPTDYASVPQELWGAPLFLIPYGWWSLPAFGHDTGFQNKLLKLLPGGSKALARLTEPQCNDLILEMMNAIKPSPTAFEKLQRDAIYEGVTIGGWHAFKEDRS